MEVATTNANGIDSIGESQSGRPSTGVKTPFQIASKRNASTAAIINRNRNDVLTQMLTYNKRTGSFGTKKGSLNPGDKPHVEVARSET